MHDKVRDSLDGSANGAAKHPRWTSRGCDARLGHTVGAGGAEHGRSGRNGGPEKRVLRQSPSYIAGWDTAGSRLFAVRPESRYRAASPYIDGTDRLAMEDIDAMNSLPERVMDYPESTPDAESIRVFVALGAAMTGAGNPEPGQ